MAVVRIALLATWLCVLSLAALLQVRADAQAGVGLARALPPDDHALAGLPFLGINIALEENDENVQTLALEELKQGGFGWVRQRFDWSALEPEPGRFDWSRSDKLLRNISAAGLVPIVVLDGSPAWARGPQDVSPHDNPLAPPARIEDFARFAAAFAQRYGASVRYYQIWDEPNIAPHWGNRWVDPVHYAQLLKAASIAVVAADADAVVLLAALAPTTDRGHLAIDEAYFLQRVYAAGAMPHFDAVAVQPFGFGHAPDDARRQGDALNFQRAAWVRRVMVEAGDAQTPLIAVRYGWNRQPNALWGAVSAKTQAGFARQALEIAFDGWPWLCGMGWAVYRPSASTEDPVWGFSLNQETADALAGWSLAYSNGAATQRAVTVAPPNTVRWLALLAAACLGGWRLMAAGQMLPWGSWRAGYSRRSRVQRGAVWLVLLALYYYATWPPFVFLLWIVAALLIWAEPQTGLWLAAAVLPFYFQHKEVQWGQLALAVPPAHAAALCMLPALATHARGARRHPNRWDGAALLWAAAVALSAISVWRWPAYWRGVLDLAAVPLLLFWAVRAFAPRNEHRGRLLAALAAGGVLVASVGLAGWLAGGGSEADGMRRLTGMVFSPNHAALYLERTLFVTLGLALSGQGLLRRLGLAATAIVAAALFLTGSRGAIFLALPVGVWAFAVCAGKQWAPRSVERFRAWVAPASALALALVAAGLSWQRLSNSATLVERAALWRQSWLLWLDYWGTGVGPGGFLWRFPAYIPAGAALDPNLLHPHNVWLEATTTAGLPGLLWLVMVMALVAGSAGKARQAGAGARQWALAGVAAGLAAALAHAQVDAFAALPDLAAWNWMAFGVLASALALPNADEGQTEKSRLG